MIDIFYLLLLLSHFANRACDVCIECMFTSIQTPALDQLVVVQDNEFRSSRVKVNE